MGKLFNLFVREVAREGVEEITCEALLEEVTSPVFSSLANWLETSGDTVCSFNGSGFRRISNTLAILVALVNILR